MSEHNNSNNNEHFFLEPNRTYMPRVTHAGGFVPSKYYHTSESAPRLDKQIEETINDFQLKEFSDEDDVFYVLDLKISQRNPNVSKIIDKLNAKILSVLDENQLLVTSSLKNLNEAKETIPKLKTMQNSIFSIRLLRQSEIIDPELDIKETTYCSEKNLTFHLVPNIGENKAQKYISRILEYLASKNVMTVTSWIDKETGNSYFNAKLTRNQLFQLMDKSPFLFKIHEKLKIRSIEPATQQCSSSDVKVANIDDERLNTLPKICIIDTGVTDLELLRRYIVQRFAEQPLVNVDDENDHGTSVASLAIFGDNIGSGLLTPYARVISHKILSLSDEAELEPSLANAIRKYPDCKTFSCSLILDGSNIGYQITTRNINQIAQKK